jgi:hypothetical protein
MKKSLFVFSIFCFCSVQANSWESLIEKLTQTRGEVEMLSKELDSLQREKQSELEQWTQRKTDLEAQVQKEQLRSLQINEKLKRLETRVKLQGKADPQAQKKLLAWIDRYDQWILSSIPFLQESRKEILKSLKSRTQKAQEPVEFILADFWAFVDSEMKLAQTNEYKIVDIQMGAKLKKCEVARLGLQSLFVVTPDKKILKAIKESAGWAWKNIDSAEDQSAILLLVHNLKNKNGSGYYHLPVESIQVGASL